MQYAWTCGCCGKQYSTLREGFAYAAPDYWFAIPAAERQSRGKCDNNLCHIEDVGLFVRGCVEIPVVGTDTSYIWGVWVSVSEQSFHRILELWDAPDVENEPSKFGWLSNAISIYPPTLNLKTNLHLRSNNIRPAIELEPTDHPLAVEQRRGITIERVLEITAAMSPHH
ncbi:MAG TPA: DUF2199 domain-containing protein [Stellaceae bacterium]|jgi:hypothetical protein|nr:DUF2199 domain-containing protein [Stellaceae bacterium]